MLRITAAARDVAPYNIACCAGCTSHASAPTGAMTLRHQICPAPHLRCLQAAAAGLSWCWTCSMTPVWAFWITSSRSSRRRTNECEDMALAPDWISAVLVHGVQQWCPFKKVLPGASFKQWHFDSAMAQRNIIAGRFEPVTNLTCFLIGCHVNKANATYLAHDLQGRFGGS